MSYSQDRLFLWEFQKKTFKFNEIPDFYKRPL